MLDLSAKISSFRKMVWSNEKRKSEKELYDSTDFSSKTLNEIKDNLEKNYKLYIEKRKEFANHGVEKVGAELRKLMPWIKK